MSSQQQELVLLFIQTKEEKNRHQCIYASEVSLLREENSLFFAR